MRGGAQSHLMRCSDGRDHDAVLRGEVPKQSATLPRRVPPEWYDDDHDALVRLLPRPRATHLGNPDPSSRPVKLCLYLGFAVWVAKLRPMLQKRRSGRSEVRKQGSNGVTTQRSPEGQKTFSTSLICASLYTRRRCCALRCRLCFMVCHSLFPAYPFRSIITSLSLLIFRRVRK